MYIEPLEMQNVLRTPNPNIARRDDSDGPHKRNRGTPRRARIGRSPMEDENSLQTEDRQNDLDQDGRPTIPPNQHLRFYEGPDSREEPHGSISPANLEDQITNPGAGKTAATGDVWIKEHR